MHIASTFFHFFAFSFISGKKITGIFRDKEFPCPAAARSAYKFKTAFVFFFKRLQKVR